MLSPTPQERFLIDGRQLSFSEETKISVDEQDHALYLDLWAVADASVQERSDLWSGYEGDSKVGFRVRCSGVHENGVPTGSFRFEEGRSEDQHVYLWDEGWEFNLELSGTLTLAGGWLEMEGKLSPSYRETPTFAVSIRKQIPASLDWSHYGFSSLRETQGAAPLQVRHLQLTEPTDTTLPGDVFNFKNLTTLEIRRGERAWDDMTKLPLNDLSERIGELSQLRELSVGVSSLRTLPQALGRLQLLERLFVTHSLLEITPEGIWNLPRLQLLYLSDNEIATIPTAIDLPSLSRLELANNKLETLPEGLARLPLLETLTLEGNPLKSLPAAYNDMADLQLSFEDKQRLLDYAYKGAGGAGTITWDDSAYFAATDPALFEPLVQQAPELAAALKVVAKKSLLLQHDETEDYQELGNTRFGGWPDLPETLAYPTFVPQQDDEAQEYHCEFLAQLDCEALAPLQDYLPRTGWLYFFIDSVHELNARVMHFDGPRSELRSGDNVDMSHARFHELDDQPYESFKARAQAICGLPFNYAADQNKFLFPGDAGVLVGEDDPLDPLRHDSRHAHEVNSYVFTQQESPELQAALKLRGRLEDWTVLLKVASLGTFQWWDAGELFFVIHKSDLARGDFSSLYCGLESS